MKMHQWNIAFCVLSSLLPVCYTIQCGHKQKITHANIPDVRTVLSIDDFEKYVVNTEMSRMYIALTEPLATKPNISFISTITKYGTTNYRLNTIAETPDVNPQCARSETILTPKTLSHGAIFNPKDTYDVISFWSSCPTRYVWSMTCTKYYIGSHKCLLRDVTIELYVYETLDDIPVTEMSKDLCSATGVKFGAIKFKWLFTYGANTKCRNNY